MNSPCKECVVLAMCKTACPEYDKYTKCVAISYGYNIDIIYDAKHEKLTGGRYKVHISAHDKRKKDIRLCVECCHDGTLENIYQIHRRKNGKSM